tara:strand:- start:63 stop:2780 length:2718 start_codon:yes stop_codon:yes gene_type:complete
MMESDSKQPTYVLVDGSSYLFRAYYALPDLRNSKGEATGAIRGVISMIRKLEKDFPESLVVVVFDAPGRTFRDDLYEDYKANRSSTPDDLKEQIQPIKDLVVAMGFPLICMEGVEADDVIGTYALMASKADQTVIISTGDKDMAQLVNESVTLVNTMTETMMDRNGVIEKFAVPPELIIDYLALMGDTVDNIPGVPKVGPKTAAKWLNEFGSLESLIDRAAEIKGKVGENLRNSLEQLPLSKALTTIKTDVEVPISLKDLKRDPADKDLLLKEFARLEFKGWLAELEGGQNEVESAQPPKAIVEKSYELITSMERLEEWLDRLSNVSFFAIDTETTSIDYMSAQLVGVSFAVDVGEAAYLPLAHDYVGVPEQVDFSRAINALKPVLENESIAKVGQNLKYDLSILASYGLTLKGELYDTMMESYVLNSVATRHNMDALARHYLDITTTSFEDVAGKGASQLTFNQVPLEVARDYAAEDADVTYRLHHALWPLIEREPKLLHIFRDVEMPLVRVLSKIERQGALLDPGLLNKQSSELGRRIEELKDAAWSLAEEEFNLDSPKQLQEIFFEKQGLPVLKKTPGGKPSTAEPVLVDLARDYELPALILEYRGLAKLKSTYTDKLPKDINTDSGRVHTSYHQAVTATGRLSSSDPNLQNIPIKTAQGRKVRAAFVAPEGKKILAADYSQIELRIMGHLSGDDGLLQAFSEGLDVHSFTASEVFNVEIQSVTEDQRRSAKAINFGLIYGMSAFGLAKQLDISRALAQDYIDSYFSRYPKVLDYMEQTKGQASRLGYVETLFGRRLYLPEINAKQVMRRQAAERTAINAPMQGTAADIIKKAMLEVDSWLGRSNVDCRMIMQVHDELVFEVAESDIDEVGSEVENLMSQSASLDVPLTVTVGRGDNWEEAH